MNILLHTIALEPARWTPERVSRPLAELLPMIAGAGFDKLEIFEPHLSLAPDEAALPGLLTEHHLTPVVLSSYLEMSPFAKAGDQFASEAGQLLARIERFGFRKVRLFPGQSPSAAQTQEAEWQVAGRLGHLADRMPGVEFLLETHDGSLADDPASLLRVIQWAARPNVGLLWQPTIFEPAAAREQFALQKPHIRHFHLQNRDARLQFVRLADGVIRWSGFLEAMNFGADVTIEFVASGVCAPEAFDLTRTLQEAVEEYDYVVKLEG